MRSKKTRNREDVWGEYPQESHIIYVSAERDEEYKGIWMDMNVNLLVLMFYLFSVQVTLAYVKMNMKLFNIIEMLAYLNEGKVISSVACNGLAKGAGLCSC